MYDEYECLKDIKNAIEERSKCHTPQLLLDQELILFIKRAIDEALEAEEKFNKEELEKEIEDYESLVSELEGEIDDFRSRK